MSSHSVDLLLLHHVGSFNLEHLSPTTLLSALLCLGLLLAVFAPSTEGHGAERGPSPPTVPYSIPLLRSTHSFGFDGVNFFAYLRKAFGAVPAMRVRLVNGDVYVVQGAKAITELFRNQTLTMTRAYGIALHSCFGMSARAVRVYEQDTSGSRHKPIAGSNVPAHRRVGFPTHENLAQGMQLGQGLQETTARFQAALQTTLATALEGVEDGTWSEHADLMTFVERTVGTAVLHCLFGPLLLSQGDFAEDLFAYDKDVMYLLRQLPRFLVPSAYRRRDKVLGAIKNWHRQALALSNRGKQANPGAHGSDLYWGCQMMRERYAVLASFPDQDADSIASTDMALIWASITNVVPSTAALCMRTLGDAELARDIRANVEAEEPGRRLDVRVLEKQALLQSVYAETLRMGVQIHVPRSSTHKPVSVGGMQVPQDRMLFVNIWSAHRDERVWNSQDGARPLDEFWAQRFLVVPGDARSGPCLNPSPAAATQPPEQQPRFSVEGLEGAWLPYGGGHHACPGRLLAKRVMLLTLATLASQYDVEITADEAACRFTSPRFGFGVEKPAGPVPFRIRRRTESASVAASATA